MSAQPFTFWLRDDIREHLKKEPNMAAVLNELLAKHYSLVQRPKDPRHLTLVPMTITHEASAAMLSLQRRWRWSKDHVVEMAIREHTGMEPARATRYSRRIAMRNVCQHQVLLPNEVAVELRKVTDAHPNKDMSTGRYISAWLLATEKRIREEESGL